jgi:sodium transport system permease protein
MAPGVELTLGNSLIPVTGVVLLLRSLLEGNYLDALPFVPPVIAVTSICCLWSIRWAVDQFNSESVLFRESERLDFRLWIKQLLCDRRETPGPAAAIFCGVLILIVKFFMGLMLKPPIDGASSFRDTAVLVIMTQLVVIATPALMMATILTRSPRQTLLLTRPPRWSLPASALLAVSLHPAAALFTDLVNRLYPMNEQLLHQIEGLFDGAPSVWQLVLLIALVPAICEELAFRGFVLSGLRHTGHRWWAITISSVFFGITHWIFQQSVTASVIGMVIGYVAIQTGSLFPCSVFHLTHNALTVVRASLCPKALGYNPLPEWLAIDEGGAYQFTWPAVIFGLILATAVLNWFRALPYAKSAEEALYDALKHDAEPAYSRT